MTNIREVVPAKMEQQLTDSAAREWDEEGFPVMALQRTVKARKAQLDQENGEWVQEKVFVLRHLPSDTSFPSAQQRLVHEIVHFHWPLVERKQLFRGHAHSVLSRLSENLARARENADNRRPPPPPANHHGDLETLKSRPMFQVPAEVLQKLPHNTSNTDRAHVVHVSIWKEFIYGPSVLMLERHCLTSRELHGIKPVTCSLKKFFNQRIVDWSLYVFFFGVYFLYCCIFHDLLALGLSLLFGSHLSIHLMASCSNIEIAFKGSLFQGPAYALIRMYCQHCTQEESAKVMWRHMAKMKHDIMNARVT